MNSIQNYGNVNFQARQRFIVHPKPVIELLPGDVAATTRKMEQLRETLSNLEYRIKPEEISMFDTYQSGLFPFITPRYQKLTKRYAYVLAEYNRLAKALKGLN